MKESANIAEQGEAKVLADTVQALGDSLAGVIGNMENEFGQIKESVSLIANEMQVQVAPRSVSMIKRVRNSKGQMVGAVVHYDDGSVSETRFE